MPPLTGLLETALYVEDVPRSVGFYTRLFGFQVVSAFERGSALAIKPGQVLLLFKKGASANMPKTPHDGDGHLHIAFSIDQQELSNWETWLQENHITIEEKTHWDKGGISLYFRDPDGHLLELATPGVWSNY